MPTTILVVDDSPTIRRVVSAILQRHGYTALGAADGEEAMSILSTTKAKADLVLLDFVMPKMNGYQFCRALRADADFSATPVVLMSAKGDRIRDQFVEQTGAIDAITKPFDAQALVAVVENAIFRVNKQEERGSSTRVLELEFDEPGSETDVITVRGKIPGYDLPGPALAGDMSVIPIGAVLQLLSLENQSGVLDCFHEATKISTTLRAGLIDVVRSSGASDEFRLGRYFIEEGIVTAGEIDAVTNLSSGSIPESAAMSESAVMTERMPGAIDPETQPRPASEAETPRYAVNDAGRRLLGALLLASGKITEAQLRSALTRQSSELLYEVLRWPRGRFEFHRSAVKEAGEGETPGVTVAAVVLEGFRRVDEWRVLERNLESFDAVLVRDDIALGTIDQGALPSKEKTVLEAIDGERSVRQIIAASHMSSFDACRILVQFLEARLIRKRAA